MSPGRPGSPDRPVSRLLPSGSAQESGSLPRVLGQSTLVVVALAVVGAVAGVVWERLWTAPAGVVESHRWVQDEAGLRGDFSGTGTYVAVAAVAGLLAGLAVTLVFRRHEIVTFLSLVVGSVLAGWLMYRVGLALGPDDPAVLARSAPDGTRLPGTLGVPGVSPFVALPTGALLALVVMFFGLGRHREPSRSPRGAGLGREPAPGPGAE